MRLIERMLFGAMQTAGVMAVWLIDGSTITSTGFPAVHRRIGQFIVSAIFWRNTSNSAVALLLMNGTAIISPGFPAGVPLEWQMAGVGDLTADGKADVIWRNDLSGAKAVWLMNDATVDSSGFWVVFRPIGSSPK
jgi:hypothetical protein